jgi:hypothetical protein
MDMYVGEAPGGSHFGATQSHKRVHPVIALLHAAVGQLDHREAAHGTLLEAASLLRKHIDPEVAQAAPDKTGGSRTWQARKVCAHLMLPRTLGTSTGAAPIRG